jgi:hypothetical protein
MKNKLRNHFASLLFVGMLFYIIHLIFPSASEEEKYSDFALIQKFTRLDFLDLNSPEDRILLRESLDFYNPQNSVGHDTLLVEIERYLTRQLLSTAGERERSQDIDLEKFLSLLKMWIKFAFIYIFVLLVTYYCVETFAIYRFVKDHNRQSFGRFLSDNLQKFINTVDIKNRARYVIKIVTNIIRSLGKAIIIMALFAPAYVIAYSFKTRFDTDSLIVMIVLGVISNGLLITYMQKYYTFLVSESRKGYVRMAIVKNLDSKMIFNKKEGLYLSSIFRINKKFPGHVLNQIYENVRFQYLNTLKEQASFLITGLIIIEMALNIQGHFCYELMQNILYKNLPVILLILFGIFLLVKLTQIVIDMIVMRHQRTIGFLPSGESE